MKISHPAEKPAPAPVPSGAVTAATHDGTKAATPLATAIPSTADASAKIKISGSATHLLSGSNSTYFDAEKVARISNAIESGTFQINPGAIADKLISNATELLTKTSS